MFKRFFIIIFSFLVGTMSIGKQLQAMKRTRKAAVSIQPVQTEQPVAMNSTAAELEGAGPAHVSISSGSKEKNVCHISHKTMLDVLKRRNLDLEKMWNRIHIDEDSIVPELPIATKILNFFALLEGRLSNERASKEVGIFLSTEKGKLMRQEFMEKYSLGKESLSSAPIFYSRKVKKLALHDFLIQEFDLRIMNFSSELVNRVALDYEMDVIGSDKLLKIECINKIRTEDGTDMFHSVALDNIAAKPSHILQALGLVMAYHFTQESLQQRKNIMDDTLHDIPLLVIRIIPHEPSTSNITINPKKIALALRRQNKLPATLTCAELKSVFYAALDEQFNQFNQPDCQLFQETELPQPGAMEKIFCKTAAVCIVFLNPLAAVLNAIIPFSAEVKPEAQSVCFTTTDNIPVCCDLNQDLSLTCYNQEIPIQCISFNLLDNDNPLNNCCTANELGVTCSMDLCTNPNAIVGPCSNGGELVNKTIDQTYESQDHEFADTLNTISKSKNFTDNEITLVRSRAQGIANLTINSDLTTRQDAIGTLVRYIRYLEKNLKIAPERKITKITISNVYDYASTNVTGDQTLYLSSQLNSLPSLKSVLGHEIAHNHQAQLLKAIDSVRLLYFLKPGFEMSADILGSLASNHSNLAALGAQWLSVNVDNTNICAIELPIINHENAETIRNLMATSIFRAIIIKESPHPDSPIRGTILLKLNTMIKAAVKYLEQIAQCPNRQGNNTQIIASNSNF